MTGKAVIAAMLAALALVSAPVVVAFSDARATFAWRFVRIAGQRQCLPVAYSLAAQERGLQHVRRVVRPMMFPFSPPDTPSFWMKDTPSALTGVWVGSGHRVIGYWHGRPESTDQHTPPAPVSAVLEYRAGAKVPARGAWVTIGGACRPRDYRL